MGLTQTECARLRGMSVVVGYVKDIYRKLDAAAVQPRLLYTVWHGLAPMLNSVPAGLSKT